MCEGSERDHPGSDSDAEPRHTGEIGPLLKVWVSLAAGLRARYLGHRLATRTPSWLLSEAARFPIRPNPLWAHPTMFANEPLGKGRDSTIRDIA